MIDRYNHPEMAEIWSDASKYKRWMEIELALLHQRTQNHKLQWLARDIKVDEKAIKKIEQRTGHDVAAFVEWLERRLSRLCSVANQVHYGITSSDVVDTAFTMQIKDANRILVGFIHQISMLLRSKTPHPMFKIAARTHGQIAEPILLSDKLHRYADLLNAAAEDMDSIPYYGRMAGSVGVYRYIDIDQARTVLDLLGLKIGALDGQIISRAYYARFMNSWALMASLIEKIATDLRLLCQTEIGEASEGFKKGQIGSSSMPHKRNPIGLENICGLARVIRGYQTVAMQNVALWHERDMSHSSAERIIFPDATILLAYMLNRLWKILISLEFHQDAAQRNLKLADTTSQQRMLCEIDRGNSRKSAHRKMR